MTLDYTVGCDAEGRLVAVRARIVGDTGAYASVGAKVLERAAGHACGAYRVPNVDVEARTVYTNNPPSGAMRGFGVPQVTFALEGCSTCWPSGSASTDGRCAGGTPSRRATGSGPASCSARASASRGRSSRSATRTTAPATPGSPAG